ncbi:MAG: hypothetical protein K2X77_07845 [Candidatus Obscuribacterales bacterium]|jgi:hypothetical protein|nr:hypothetical protein [Candidatus Obscuribacterales bacterium]
MKTQKFRHTTLFALTRIVVACLLPILFVTFTAQATQGQKNNFNPGDSVEIDPTGMGAWEKGVVVPFRPGDRMDGYTVRVKVDHYTLYPDGMLVQIEHMRAAAPAPQGAANPVQNAQQGQPPAPVQRANPPQHVNHQAAGGGNFAPGERVQVDKAAINSWEHGVIVPYLPGDTFRDEMVRVKVDGYTLYPQGMLIPKKRVKPSNEPLPAVANAQAPDAPWQPANPAPPAQPINQVPQAQPNPVRPPAAGPGHAPGRGGFKTGDRVEADKAGINSWEPGTIMDFLPNDQPDGTWYRVKLDASAGTLPFGLYITKERVRPGGGNRVVATHNVGARVKVWVNHDWSDATIMKVGTGIHRDQYFVHYDGDPIGDEWVEVSRIQ